MALTCPSLRNAASKSENLEDMAAGVMGMLALVEGHSAKVPQDFDVTAISTKILSLHRCRLSRSCAVMLLLSPPLEECTRPTMHLYCLCCTGTWWRGERWRDREGKGEREREREREAVCVIGTFQSKDQI